MSEPDEMDEDARWFADDEPDALPDESVVIHEIGGFCPVQATGLIHGQEFYFRARGQRWSIGIGGDTVMHPTWRYEEPYGDEPFAAGYMDEREARAFIRKAADLFSAPTQPRTGDEG